MSNDAPVMETLMLVLNKHCLDCNLFHKIINHHGSCISISERPRINHLNNKPPHDKTIKMACAPSEDRSAWASAQSDQSLHCPHEESLGP